MKILICTFFIATVATLFAPTNADIIENFMAAQVVRVNDTSFDKNSLVGTLSNMTCTGFSLGSGSSTSRVSSKHLAVVIDVASISCVGNFVVWEKYLPLAKSAGQVSVSVGSSKMGPITFKITTDDKNLPIEVNITQCSTTVTISDIQFSKTIFGPILNTFRKVIIALMDPILSDQLCSIILPTALDTVNSDLLPKVNKQLREYLVSVEPSPAPALPQNISFVNWNTYKPLRSLDQAFEILGANHSHILNAFSNALTHNTGQFTIPHKIVLVENQWIPQLQTNASLELLSLSLSHLDKFLETQLYQPRDNNSITFAAVLNRLGASIPISLAVKGGGPFGDEDEDFAAGLSFEVKDTTNNVTISLPFVSNCMTELSMGQIALSAPSCTLACTTAISATPTKPTHNSDFENSNFTVLFSPNVTHLLFHSTPVQFSLKSISGDFVAKVVKLFNGLADLAISDFSDVMPQITSGFVGTVVKDRLNEEVVVLANELKDECLAYVPPASRDEDIVNFETSEPIKLFNTLMNEQLGAAGTNQVMDIATSVLFGTPGTFLFPFSVAPPNLPAPLYVAIDSISAQHVDSLTEMEIGVPIGPQTISNKLAASVLPKNALKGSPNGPIALKFTAIVDYPPLFTSSREYLNIQLNIDSLSTVMSAYLAFNATAFREMNILNATDVNCFLASFSQANITTLTSTVQHFKLNVTNATTSVGKLLERAALSFNDMLPEFLEFPPGMPTLASTIIENQMKASKQICGVQSNSQSSGSKGWSTLDSALVGIGGAVGVVAIVAFAVVAKKKRSRNSREPGQYALQSRADMDHQARSEIANMRWYSLSLLIAQRTQSRNIYWQIAIPLLLLATLAAKVLSLILLVSRVKVSVDVNDEDHKINLLTTYLIDFTFSNMVEYFWKSEAYLISLLIVGGTCVFPITKVFSLAVAWYLPMKEKRRRLILGFFDHMGRMAFIDAFFLSQIITLFKVTIQATSVLSISLRATINDGIIWGVVSTILGGITSHLMLGIHQTTAVETTPSTSTRGRFSFLTHPLPYAFCSAVFLVLALLFPFATYTAGGLAGVAQGDNNKVDFYALSLAWDLPHATEPYGYAIIVSAVILILLVIAPTISVLLLLSSAMFRARGAGAVLLSKVQKILWFSLGWTGFDVLLWAAIAGVLEINMIAVWMINNKYSEECSTAETATEQACAHYTSELRTGFWMLISACCCMFATSAFNVHHLTHPEVEANLGSSKSNYLNGNYRSLLDTQSTTATSTTAAINNQSRASIEPDGFGSTTNLQSLRMPLNNPRN